jgi:hypothetical protein
MRKILMAASAALLASTVGVVAQDSAGNAANSEIKKMEEGAASDNSAKDVAPGQVKEGTAANEVAPGQKKEDGTAANEIAPGQTKEDAAASDNSAKDVAPGQVKQGTAANEVAPGQKKEDGTAANEVAPGETKNDAAAGANTSGETTASINLTAEQQTEVRTVFREVQVEPANIDIEVNIGTVAPETIVLHPLPARIIEIVPAYRSYKYFVLADGTIVIVVPDTRKVVYVITA